MDRAKAWDHPLVWLLIERVVLGGIASVLVVLILNPMDFDWQYRIATGMVVIGVGWMAAHAVETRNRPKSPTAIHVQLLPMSHGEITGAVLSFSNNSKSLIKTDREVSISLRFPMIRTVKLDDPQRIRVIGGGQNANYIQVLVPELVHGEIRKVIMEFAVITQVASVQEWARMFEYPDTIDVIGIGSIGPEEKVQ
jgi:hypothetical protein